MARPRSKPAVDAGTSSALGRGLEILRSFQQGERFVSNAELASRTGIPKATVSRLTHTLNTFGYLNFSEETGKYSIAPGVLALGYSVLAYEKAHIAARPLMQRLATESNSVVGLGMRDGLYMIFLEDAKGKTAVTRNTSVGYRVPIAGSAMGWACLAGMLPRDRGALLEKLAHETPAEEWSARLGKIEHAMAEVWKRGYCISFGDIDPLVNAVAVPFLHTSGNGMYAINVMAPAFALTVDRIQKEIGPKLLALVEDLRGALQSS